MMITRYPIGPQHCCFAFLVLLVGCSRAADSKPIADSRSSGEQEEVSDAGGAPAVEASEPTTPPEMQISAEAFRMAAYEGRLESVRKAIEAGGDVNAAEATTLRTALHMAAYNGHSETVEFLLENGATLDCRDFEGKTPLIHACTGPFAETVEILVEAGADINAKESTEAFTPLMMAAGLGQTEVVKVLLRHDVDKALLDNDQESAIDHARNSGHAEIVQLLE